MLASAKKDKHLKYNLSTLLTFSFLYSEVTIVTIEDRKIAKKIVELYDLYLAIKKKKSLTTERKGGH